MVETQPQIICSVANVPLLGQYAPAFEQFGQGISSDYDGISALPFRTKDIVSLYQRSFPPVILIEDAWNPGRYDNIGLAMIEGIYGHLKRSRGDRTEPPILPDTLLFPGKETTRNITHDMMEACPDAHFGSIDFDSRFPKDRTYVHMQSEFRPHNKTSDELLALSEETGMMLLFDPTHLLDSSKVSYPDKPTTEPAAEWEKQLEIFASRIVGVDIHALSPKEMNEFLGRSGKLYKLALASQELCNNLQFLRVETLVPLVSQVPLTSYQQDGIDYLNQIARVLKEITQN